MIMLDINSFQEMDCPVCGEFHFSKLDESDLEIYKYIQCPHCGWKYDLAQTENPELSDGTNKKSLEEYKQWFLKKLEEDPEYDYQDLTYVPKVHSCPVCGRYKFSDEGSFETCPRCGWIDDKLMEDEPDCWAGCANDLCLNEYKKRYERFIGIKPTYNYSKDGYL